MNLAVFPQLRFNARGFGAPRFGTHRSQYRQFIEHNRHILDKRAIRQVTVDIQRAHIGAASAERPAILLVLLDGALVVDRSLRDERALALLHVR